MRPNRLIYELLSTESSSVDKHGRMNLLTSVSTYSTYSTYKGNGKAVEAE